MLNYFKILFLVSFFGMLLGCSSSHENTGYYEYERYINPYYRPSGEQVRYGEQKKVPDVADENDAGYDVEQVRYEEQKRVPVEDSDCKCLQEKRRHLPQCERRHDNAPQYVVPQQVQPQYVVPQPQVVPQYVVPQQVQPQYVVPQKVQPQYVVPQPQAAPQCVEPRQVVPQYVVPVYPQGYVPVQPSSYLQDDSSKTAVAQNKQAETEDTKNSDEMENSGKAVEKKDAEMHFKKADLQNVNLPKSMQCKMLYMEQWDELAREIADEIFLGLGNQGMVSVAASGITPFKKGFRELLITALSRRGLSVVDADGNVPILEFDVLPVSKGRQISFFLGDAKENPIQIMVNTSISRLGRYLYRKSSIYAVPGEEMSQYVEEENSGSTPFKTYQLVSN